MLSPHPIKATAESITRFAPSSPLSAEHELPLVRSPLLQTRPSRSSSALSVSHAAADLPSVSCRTEPSVAHEPFSRSLLRANPGLQSSISDFSRSTCSSRSLSFSGQPHAAGNLPYLLAPSLSSQSTAAAFSRNDLLHLFASSVLDVFDPIVPSRNQSFPGRRSARTRCAKGNL